MKHLLPWARCTGVRNVGRCLLASSEMERKITDMCATTGPLSAPEADDSGGAGDGASGSGTYRGEHEHVVEPAD